MNEIKNNLYEFILSQNIKLDKDVFDYGFAVVKSYLIFIVCLFPIALINKTFNETILYLIVFVSLRQYLGGYHFDNQNYCLLFSVLISIMIPFLNRYITYLNVFVRIVVMIVTFININFIGVVDHKNKRLSVKEKKRFKLKANVVLIVYTIIGILFYNEVTMKYLNIMFLTIISMDVNLVLANYLKNEKNNY